MEAAQRLLQTPLGNLLRSSEAAELVQAAKTRTVGRGQFLSRAGEPGESLYIVLSGGLDVVLGAPTAAELVVASIGPGQIAGEVEVMTGASRVASLRASDETTVLELSASQLEALLKDNRPAATKLVTAIAKTLARRLAAVNQRIVSKSAAAQPAPTSEQPLEVDVADVEPLDDEELDVLDKLWG